MCSGSILSYSTAQMKTHTHTHTHTHIIRKTYNVLVPLQTVFKNEVKSKSRGVYDVNKEYMKVIIQFGLVSLILH